MQHSWGIAVAKFLKTKFSCNSGSYGIKTLLFVIWDNRFCLLRQHKKVADSHAVSVTIVIVKSVRETDFCFSTALTVFAVYKKSSRKLIQLLDLWCQRESNQ